MKFEFEGMLSHPFSVRLIELFFTRGGTLKQRLPLATTFHRFAVARQSTS
jgi:hypothetical protein